MAAASALDSASLLQPQDIQVLQSLASTQCRLKAFDRAAATFRKILQLSPDLDVAQQGLKVCEEELLRQTQATATPCSSPGQKRKEDKPSPGTASSSPAAKSSPGAAPSSPVAKPSPGAAPCSPVAKPHVAAAAIPTVSTVAEAAVSGGGASLTEVRASGNYFSLDSLRAPGPFPSGVDQSKRELYLRCEGKGTK